VRSASAPTEKEEVALKPLKTGPSAILSSLGHVAAISPISHSGTATQRRAAGVLPCLILNREPCWSTSLREGTICAMGYLKCEAAPIRAQRWRLAEMNNVAGVKS
jgi:hypothetical protein